MVENTYDQRKPHCSKLKAIADLSLVTFYYILRVGEYKKTRVACSDGRSIRATRMVQFTVGNIGFFKDGKILTRHSPLHSLLKVDQCTLK